MSDTNYVTDKNVRSTRQYKQYVEKVSFQTENDITMIIKYIFNHVFILKGVKKCLLNEI